MDMFYIDGYYLDNEQINAIKYMDNLLLVSGAGCGKTSTILGKIKYLISMGYKESDILCISLTNEIVNELKNKINKLGYNIDCYTFHKLGLNILKSYYNNINICSSDYLSYIINEYFNSICRYSFRKYLLFIKFKCFNYNSILHSNEYMYFKKDIEYFINIFKSKDLSIRYLYKLIYNGIYKIEYYFILEIYKIYTLELSSTNSFDFNDMISISSKIILDNNIKLRYKYIIIDEFQDSSLIRLNLIKNIISISNAKILCVGDDYQSIYKFNGSDISLFLNFKKYFKDSNVMYLKNTYRNCSELLYISTSFICKNKYQFKKNLVSNKHICKPIVIIYYNDFNKCLDYVIKLLCDNYMIIGRYNNHNFKNYYTAHKSKGLECDNIILIDLFDDIMGFPSKLNISKYSKVLFDIPLYKYDEERRLFYVALTRTKNKVYLLVSRNSVSVFVNELIRDYSNYIDVIKKKDF